MKTVIFVMCLVAVAGWAGEIGFVEDSASGTGQLRPNMVAGPDTFAVADSGYLFMYGNEIPQPFIFTVERDTVRINGIPYRPRLRRYKPRIDTGWEPPMRSPEREDLIRAAKNLGEELLARGDAYSDVVDSVSQVFSRSPLVEGARNGAIAVTVEFKDGDGVYVLGVPVTTPPRVRGWEEIWVETQADIPTQYAIVLMEPYDILEEGVHNLSIRLYEEGVGFEERIQAMGDMLTRSELVERVDVKPAQKVINIYYKGITGSYAMGVGQDPTERPLYLTNPEEAKHRSLEASREVALRLAHSLSQGSLVIVGPGDLALGGPDRFLYLEAARRIGRGESTEDDLTLFRETMAKRLMNPVLLEGVMDAE